MCFILQHFKTNLTLSLLKTNAYPHLSERSRETVKQWYNLNLESITSFESTLASFFYMIQFAKSS